MENNNIFAGMPVLTLITNFSQSGSFERIHLVTERKISGQLQNQLRVKTGLSNKRFWNGPNFKLRID